MQWCDGKKKRLTAAQSAKLTELHVPESTCPWKYSHKRCAYEVLDAIVKITLMFKLA